MKASLRHQNAALLACGNCSHNACMFAFRNLRISEFHLVMVERGKLAHILHWTYLIGSIPWCRQTSRATRMPQSIRPKFIIKAIKAKFWNLLLSSPQGGGGKINWFRCHGRRIKPWEAPAAAAAASLFLFL